MISHKQSRDRHRPSLHPLSGVLAVIQPHVTGRGTLESATREMVVGRMALAMRNDPPEALQLALVAPQLVV